MAVSPKDIQTLYCILLLIQCILIWVIKLSKILREMHSKSPSVNKSGSLCTKLTYRYPFNLCNRHRILLKMSTWVNSAIPQPERKEKLLCPCLISSLWNLEHKVIFFQSKLWLPGCLHLGEVTFQGGAGWRRNVQANPLSTQVSCFSWLQCLKEKLR